ncbi:hypothetical protein [Haliangium ochraceum]|uniref:DUF2381 family protein n=1 Tax=Haliangium ochraceum (strain DSM 14365 / JCM 11303 / SMP-2) TaxID=502025 RepID=D0LVF5_HALO1|nr:hypothetical protein [Haliangium ochraceum]ACY17516.1 hypothetical protein Hoch_5028 [Haliangium ochraceum DSM 14365]
MSTSARSLSSAPRLRFDVPRTGGAFTVPVHPDVVTVLYFPAEVVMAYAAEESPGVALDKQGTQVNLRPAADARRSALTIVCAAFRVGLLLERADAPGAAAVQVEFREREAEDAFAARVERELGRRLRARELMLTRAERDLARLRGEFERTAESAAARRVAAGLLVRHHLAEGGAEASGASVVLRMHRVLWIGRDAFVFASLENRGRAPCEVTRVALRARGVELDRAAAFAPPAAADARSGALGVVAPGASGRCVVAAMAADAWRGVPATLAVLLGAERREAVRLQFPFPR